MKRKICFRVSNATVLKDKRQKNLYKTQCRDAVVATHPPSNHLV